MNKEELNQQYTRIAVQMGDRAFKLQELEAALAKLRSEMADLTRAKKALEGQLATIKDDSNGQAALAPTGPV